jgi:hypothetical protein
MAVPSSLMLPVNRWQLPSGEKSGLVRSSVQVRPSNVIA